MELNSPIFLGNKIATLGSNMLHKRLEFALSELSGLQQGVEDDQEGDKIISNIEDVIMDIIDGLLYAKNKENFVNKLYNLTIVKEIIK